MAKEQSRLTGELSPGFNPYHKSNIRTSPYCQPTHPTISSNNDYYKCDSPRTLPSTESDRSRTPISNNSLGEEQMDSSRHSEMYFAERNQSPYDSGQGSSRTNDGYSEFVDRFSMMTKYEDVEVFKSSDPTSQVSSSTDSGYEHGHHMYERLGDNSRYTGMHYTWLFKQSIRTKYKKC